MTKFNEMFDIKKLQESLNEVKENGSGDYPDIPVGKYEVKVEKIELGESKSKMPMAKVQFRIVEGDFKKCCLFYNQVLVGKDKQTGNLTAFGIHNFNTFLNSLEPSLAVEFKDFNQYAELLLDIAEDVANLVYEIQYSKKNDFPVYKVLEVFED